MIENEFKEFEYKIEIVETPSLSEEYIAFREQNWLEKVEEWESAGKEIFNGELYRLMGVEGDTVKLGIMSYADRLVREKLSVDEITQRFGKDYVMKNACVDVIVVTSDGKVAVGVKKNSVDLRKGKLGYIGGNMNADEVVINSFEDIYTMITREIEEESNIVPDRDRLSFVKLGVADTWASFYFIYKLGISSEDIQEIYKDDEFAEFITMTPEEIANTERSATTDLNLSKEWIMEVVS